MDTRWLTRAQLLLQEFLNETTDDAAVASLRELVAELKVERIEAIEKRLAELEREGYRRAN